MTHPPLSTRLADLERWLINQPWQPWDEPDDWLEVVRLAREMAVRMETKEEAAK